MGQFKALLTKNWILYKRSWLGNIIEFFVPIFWAVFILIIDNIWPSEQIKQIQYVGSTTPDIRYQAAMTPTSYILK